MLYLKRTFLECSLIKPVILKNVPLNFGGNNQHGSLLI